MSRRVPVTLRVNVDATWLHGTRVQVYTDWGTGTIDTSKPLLNRPLDPYARKPRPGGLGANRLGEVPLGAAAAYLGGDGPMQHALGSVSLDSAVQSFEVTVHVPDACAAWKFAAQALDEGGNAQGAALDELTAYVSGREPRPVTGLTLSGYDGGTDKLTFTFDA